MTRCPDSKCAGGPPIPRWLLPKMIGKGVHLASEYRGKVWVLEAYGDVKCLLRTPKTNFTRTAWLHELRFTRTNAHLINSPGVFG